MYREIYLILILFSEISQSQEIAERKLYGPRFRTFLDLIKKLSQFFDASELFPNQGYNEISDKILRCVNAATKVDNKQAMSETNRKFEKIASEHKYMSTLQLIHRNGYIAETHLVQTRDGYILEIYKILAAEKLTRKKKISVLLHHGLMGSSDDWLLSPGKALPYMLVDAGHDVWLTNARGNKYSKTHAGLSVESNEFWDFSFHEIGQYDLPSTIDYIKINSESDININVVGHSMGGTTLLILLSSLPEYHKVVKSAILLAPLAFMSNIKGPLILLADFYKKNGHTSLDFLGVNEFMPIQSFPRQFIEKYCKYSVDICSNPLLFLANSGKTLSNTDTLQNILAHIPAGTSAKTIKHYIQLINSGLFCEYDYGESNNFKKHGSRTPPSYDLSNITLPIVLYSSRDDWLCTRSNMLTLLHSLPNVVIHHTVTSNGFSHTDFIWGQNVSNLVFRSIKDILENINY